MIEAVLLDAGNTVVELNWARLSLVLLRHGFEFPPDAIREAAGRTRAAVDAYLSRSAGSTEAADARAFLLGLVLDRLGVPAGGRRALLPDLLSPAAWRWNLPTPGCAEALETLAASGYRLAIVSNSDGSVDRLLEEAGVAHHFETIVDSGAVGVEKPDPAIFRIALDRMNLPPERVIYVGDIPAVDIAGARAAGIRGILVDPFDAFPDAGVPRIGTLEGLLPLLRTLA